MAKNNKKLLDRFHISHKIRSQFTFHGDFTMRSLLTSALATALALGSLSADIKLANSLDISGFVDMSYSSLSPDAAGAKDTTTMAMDQAEIDFKLDLGSGIKAQLDLATYAMSSGNAESVVVEQAFVEYAVTDMVTLTLGKWDSAVGYEGTEPMDMFQNSYSLTSDLMPPAHTGLMLGFDNGQFNASFGMINSLTDESNPDDNDEMGYVIHAGFTPVEGLTANLNYATSNEKDGPADGQAALTGSEDVTLMTFDVEYAAGALTAAFEYAAKEVDTGTTAEDTAMMLMGNYAFNERIALTVRYSQNEDTAGMKATEFTISPSYVFTENWTGLIEYRSEDHDAGYAGGTTGTAGSRLAIETTVSF